MPKFDPHLDRRNAIKSIPVAYNGVSMRSMAEARWAMALDKMDLSWSYEPLFMSLRNGQWYRPDFRLNDFPIYLEVKGNITKPDVYTTMLAALSSPGYSVILLAPVPEVTDP